MNGVTTEDFQPVTVEVPDDMWTGTRSGFTRVVEIRTWAPGTHESGWSENRPAREWVCEDGVSRWRGADAWGWIDTPHLYAGDFLNDESNFVGDRYDWDADPYKACAHCGMKFGH